MTVRGGKALARKIKGTIVELQPKRGVNPFSNFVENLCEVRRVNAASLPRPETGIVKIALLSMPRFTASDIAINDYYPLMGKPPKGVDLDDCRRSLVRSKAGVSARFLAAYKEALLYCVNDLKAQVVCVSELGLPQAAVPVAAAQRFAYDLSRSKNVLIIAGTAHDNRTLYNTGYLYHAGGGWAFHKTLSATGMGEYIASPALRRVLTIKTFGLRIAVMICLDVADYATLASVIRVADKVDIILVPCYTEKFDKMLDVAKIASKALPGVVAMVNAHVPNAVSHFARFGEDEEPRMRREFTSGAVASMFEIDHEVFHEDRIRAQNAPDRGQLDWLFGNRDLPHLLAAPKPSMA